MNMNRDIVNRALFATGQAPLPDGAEGNSVYGLCRAFYISTFTEALSEAEWVGGRKRAKLVRTGRPVIRNREYRFAYDTPYDCAKPIELQDNEFFITEDRLIHTNVPRAELLYVSNGKVLRPAAVLSGGKPDDMPDVEYLSSGPPGTECDYTIYPGTPEDIADELPQDPAPDSDYPDYAALDYEPKFYEYLEKKLAANFAMKLSEKPELYAQLLQAALLVKQQAEEASRSARAAKIKENPWWSDTLGLGTMSGRRDNVNH